jgi:hypothetical protein
MDTNFLYRIETLPDTIRLMYHHFALSFYRLCIKKFLGLCTTATYFGDKHVLQQKQIYTIVDTIYDSLTLVQFENIESSSIHQKEILFDEFVKALLQQKAVQDIIVLPLQKQRTSARHATTKSVDNILVKSVTAITPILRKSAMKKSSTLMAYATNFGITRDDESSVKIYNTIPKSPRGNSNKYMPLIDEIEKDAKTFKRQQFTSAIVLTSLPSDSDDTIVVTSSNDIDDEDGVDEKHMNFTPSDDDECEENSLQDEEEVECTIGNDDENNHQRVSSVSKTLTKQSKKKYTQPSTTITNMNHHQPNNNNIYSMLYETSTTVSPSSVVSADLSSHMSSVMLTPLAHINISSNNNSVQ